MKTFRFPYERVMEWRGMQAEQERQRLELLHSTRTRLGEESNSLANDIVDSQTAFVADAQRTAEDLRQLAAFVGALRTREGLLESQSLQCEQQISVQSERCTGADRNHELLVRMRKRHWTTWERDLALEMEQTAADSWLSRHARHIGGRRPDEGL